MRRLIAAAIVGSMLTCGAVAMAQLAYPRHPHLSAAVTHLKEAITNLQKANEKEPGLFGGHRDKAEALCNQALQEIQEAVNYSNAHMPKK